MPFVEISKRPKDLLLYLPTLIKNAWSLSKILKKESASIVHINDMYNMVGIASKLFAQFKLIAHVRRMPESFPATVYKIWYWMHKLYTDKMIAVSEANYAYFRTHKEAVVVYDSLLEKEEEEGVEISKTSKIKILYLANYTKGKGQNHALKVFKKIRVQLNRAVEMHFYGGDFGLNKNKLYRIELEKLAEEYQITNNVKFLDATEDVERTIKEYDIVLNLSDSESFSNVSLEALYYGVPLVATNVGGTKEMFEHGKSGYLVEPRNYDDTSKYLIELINNYDLRVQFSLAGKNYVRSKFSHKKTSGALKSIYNNA